MSEDDEKRARRAAFLRQLATRDLYAWLGIPRDAGDDAIREAAERMRKTLSSTPMPQKRRATERAFCDQGERALLRPPLRREYDALLGSAAKPSAVVARTLDRNRAEREARLTAARQRLEHYGADDARMAPGRASLLVEEGAEERMAAAYRAAARITDAAPALRAARRARVEGDPIVALTHAERAHRLGPTAGALNTLGAARRDVGDLEGSEHVLRESLRLLSTVRENAPGWVALAATLRAAGKLAEATHAAETVLGEEEDDAHAWRALAMIAADQGDAAKAGEAWERSARLGLDVPGALQGLQDLRKDLLARGDRTGVAGVELRISRLRQA